MTAANPFGGRWATVSEVANACDVTTRTVRYWCKSGKLVAKKIMGDWRIDLEHVKRGRSVEVRNVWSAIVSNR